MPVYRFITKEPLSKGAKVCIDGSEFSHLKKVLRLKEGDELSLIDGKGALALAHIESLEKNCANVTIAESSIHKKPYDLVLIQGLLRHTKLDYLIEKATELGVTQIFLYAADKGDVKVLSEAKIRRLEILSLAALKQSGALFQPKIAFLKTIEGAPIMKKASFYGDLTPKAMVFHQLPPISNATLFVGPESGFSDRELAYLNENEVMPITLNSHTLRAETAAILGLGFLAHALEYPSGLERR